MSKSKDNPEKDEKKSKQCDNCGENEKDCNCKYKKIKKGSYGLDTIIGDDDDNDQGGNAGMDGMAEALKEPSHKQLDGFSKEKREKKLSAFKAQASEAKARGKDKARKAELASERSAKGIRFYDAKGSGYMKGGKKTYD